MLMLVCNPHPHWSGWPVKHGRNYGMPLLRVWFWRFSVSPITCFMGSHIPGHEDTQTTHGDTEIIYGKVFEVSRIQPMRDLLRLSTMVSKVHKLGGRITKGYVQMAQRRTETYPRRVSTQEESKLLQNCRICSKYKDPRLPKLKNCPVFNKEGQGVPSSDLESERSRQTRKYDGNTRIKI